MSLANVLHPTNDSERQLSRHLLETLVQVDCDGEVRPGLAESWSRERDGGWVFTLREGARFPGGSPLSPEQVVSRLLHAERERSLGIDTAVALDDRRLRVTMSPGGNSALRLLAHPAFAILNGMTAGEASVTRIVFPAQGGLPVVQFDIVAGGDPRDALDRGADLLVTRNPALLEYVAGRPELSTFPLPWTRTYVLVEPGTRSTLSAAVNAEAARNTLARDAVRADARPSEPPYWWMESEHCSRATPSSPSPASSRIVYPAADEVARALAERIVALVPAGTGLRAGGLALDQFSASLESGSELGYIMPLPRESLLPCPAAGEWPQGWAVTPLIDTRAHAIVRRGSAPLTVDWDGTVRLDAGESGWYLR